MEKRFEELKKSVMFNLSLSSKELFHSNFLGYLFENDSTLFNEITGITNFTIENVSREYKNIDIEVKGKDGRKILIENKVKDIIDQPQLDKILNTNTDYDGYLLFSLLGNNLQNIGSKYLKWKEIGYEHIISILKKHTFKDELINMVKNDYCAFMTNMISLLQQHYLQCDSYMLHWNGNKLLEQYKSVRLHDVFQKYGVSHFVNYFKDKFKETEIISSFGYVRNGIMNFTKEYNKDGLSCVEIQIEDGQYRRSIVGKIKSEEKLLNMFESIGWFKKDWRSARNLNYLSYDHKDGSKRWYQVQETVENMSYNDLSNKIITDFDNVIKKIVYNNK